MWVAADDREFAMRLARYCACNPVALGPLEYQRESRSGTYHSDKPTGPTAGSETLDALEFLARVASHIPDKGQVLQRYYGWYANRTRGIRRRAGAHEQPPAVEAESVPPSLPEAAAAGRSCCAGSLRSTRCGVPGADTRCASSPSLPSPE